MKRLAIFAFYDPKGIVDSYVEDLLKGIRPYIDYLIAVSNGRINQGLSYIERYADEIVVRPNRGFDGGAYKDVILMLIQTKKITEYDQLILFNDTIYGFFYPLSELFHIVDNDPEADIWGMTEHSGRGEREGVPLSWHLQGYFLVIQHKVLCSDDFYEFWDGLEYPEDYTSAIFAYEIGFSKYFLEKGYILKSIYDTKRIGISRDNELGNLYFSRIYDLVTRLRYPVLKVKSIENMSGLETLRYIEEQGIFTAKGIWEHYRRRLANGIIANDAFDLYALDEFCKKYSLLYIYGYGEVGRRIYKYMVSQGYSLAGFLVSKKNTPDGSEDRVFEFSGVDFDRRCGIIIGMKREFREEVIGDVFKRVSADQVFMSVS